MYDRVNRQRCLCVRALGERPNERERGLIRIKSNLAMTSNPQYRSFRAARLLCKQTARQRLTDLSLKPFYLMVAYSPGIQYAFMHDSSGNNLNYYSGGNHFRNAALRITFSLIPLIPPSRFRLISIHPQQLIFSVQLQSSVFPRSCIRSPGSTVCWDLGSELIFKDKSLSITFYMLIFLV